MKTILIVISLFVSFNLFAQESFEGTVKYSLRALTEKDTIEMQIDFAANAIKVSIFEPNKQHRNSDYLLVSFDSGKAYTVNHNHKSYTSHKLVERKPVNEVPQLKTIAGYSTIGEVYNEEGINHIFGSMLSSKTIFYTAEKLFYNLPEKYQGNFELMMIQKNRIVLGAEIDLAPRLGLFGKMGDDEDSTRRTFVFIEAKEIVPKKFSADEFSIPADFVKNRPYTYTPGAAMDSVRMIDSIMYADSAIMAPQVDFGDTTIDKPSIKKKSKSPAKKKSPVKQNAIRRNDN